MQTISGTTTANDSISAPLDADEQSVSPETKLRLFVICAVLCAAGFAVVSLLPKTFYHLFSTATYLTIHTTIELASIVVSFAVFVVGWYGYKQNTNLRNLFIGIVFLVVGMMDFVHTLSYIGMPAFLSENTISKASTYWLAARLTCGIGLLATAFTTTHRNHTRFNPWLPFSIAIIAVVSLISIVSFAPHMLPSMYAPDVGLMPLKVVLEWVVVAMYTVTIFAFGINRRNNENVFFLQIALIMSIASELSFTLFGSATDTFDLLGHVYKMIAYYLIFRGLFVSSFQRPYYELVSMRNQIEQSFSRIGDALASGLELDQVLNLIVEISADMLKTKHAAVMLMRSGELMVLAQVGISDHRVRVPIENSTAGEAVLSKQPMIITDIDEVRRHNPGFFIRDLEGAAARSTVTAPIMCGTDVLGIVQVYSTEVAAFGLREAELLAGFARQAAVAITNSIHHERDHTVAETLQRSLLPSAPNISGLDIAVRYVPADHLANVGGDLYDVFSLDEDHLVIVIGDVCGHGVEAASIMAMTEYTIRGFLIHGMPPDEALEHANRTLCQYTDDSPAFVTAFLGVLDIPNRTLKYANAGHHMPLALGGGSRTMALNGGLPLGVEESTEYMIHTMDLKDASGLLLYTDGLVEARRNGELYGNSRLCIHCDSMMHSDARQMLGSIVERVRDWSGMLQDDIALLTVKW